MTQLLELILTLSPTQHAQLGRDIAALKSALGAESNTAAILEACRRQAVEARLRESGGRRRRERRADGWPKAGARDGARR